MGINGQETKISINREASNLEIALACSQLTTQQILAIGKRAAGLLGERINRYEPHAYDGTPADMSNGRGCGVCGNPHTAEIHTSTENGGNNAS
jgi:hypothetical protein